MRRKLALLALALGLSLQVGVGNPSPASAQRDGDPGEPGPSAPGVPVDPRGLPPPRPDARLPREIPGGYPDEELFRRLKKEANEGVGQSGASSSSGPSTGFPSVDILDIGDGTYIYNPPDGAIAVSSTRILVAVNGTLAVYSKTGVLQAGFPKSFESLYGAAEAGIFDPRAIYDAARRRFVLLAVQRDSPSSIFYRLAVSQTSDPSGDWCTYALNANNGKPGDPYWADFPGLGMDGNNLYITSNQFQFFFPGQFKHSRALAIPKSSVYFTGGSCPTATSKAFNSLKYPDNQTAFTVQPADQPDASAGFTSTMYLLSAKWANSDRLAVWKLSQTGSSLSTLTLASPKWVTVAPFSIPADAAQKGTTAKIGTGDTRLGATPVHRWGKLYASNTTGSPAKVQWYVIIPSGSSYPAASASLPNLAEGGAYYFPSVMPGCATATCASPNVPFLALEFTGSDTNQFASALGHVAGVGTATTIQAGLVPFVFTNTNGNTYTPRWGDYSAAAADPADPGTVWLFGEYAKGPLIVFNDGDPATDPDPSWTVWGTAVGKATASSVTP